MIAIPCWIIMGLFAWFYPVHNLLNPPVLPLSDYQLMSYTTFDNHTIVVYSILTQDAYTKHGFYEYYKKTCNISCLTVSLNQNGTNYQKLKTDVNTVYWIHPQEETGNSAFVMFSRLNYHFITDIDIDKNPGVLDRYDKIILLHDEYATLSEWNAIKEKKHVIYLYPNSMYAQVSINYDTDTETLVKGHGYKDMYNAFDSGTDTKGEYDLKCKNAYWKPMPNGIEYSCYPELDIVNNLNLIKSISQYPFDTSFNSTLELKNS